MLVVTGGSAKHPEDRRVDPQRMRAVQALGSNGFDAVAGFSPGAAEGVSNLAVVGSDIWWSTGADLRIGPTGAPVHVASLDDVHELTVTGACVLLANTGREEVVEVDTERLEVTRRYRIAEGILHMNQVFDGLDGRRYALVHHVTGRQFRRRVAGRLLKVQGDGGVIDLERGTPIPLRLTAPHSARLVEGEVWIADSGRARVVRYDEDWKPVGSFPTTGWGRGAGVVDGTYWLGLSPLRPRYRGFVDGIAITRPEVHAIDIRTLAPVERFVMDGIDKINGLHVVPPAAAGAITLGRPGP